MIFVLSDILCAKNALFELIGDCNVLMFTRAIFSEQTLSLYSCKGALSGICGKVVGYQN